MGAGPFLKYGGGVGQSPATWLPRRQGLGAASDLLRPGVVQRRSHLSAY